MTTYGLLPTGLLVKTQDTVRTEMNTSLQAQRGASLDVSDGSLIGVLAGILSEREANEWALAQAVGGSQDPDAATGAALDALCALTGVYRVAAYSSTVTETLTGTPATVVPSGTQMKTASTGNLFATTAAATIATLAAWAQNTAYTIGARVTANGNAYQCTIQGTSLNSGTGPSGTGSAIADNTCTWMYLGAGTGAIDVAAASVTKDAIVAVAGDLTVIQTPVGGWTGCINVLAALTGAPTQSDSQLRLTRVQRLSGVGNSPQDSIRAALLGTNGVTTATVFVNNTDTVDSNGQSAHSVQAVVQGGAAADIGATLYANVAAGIVTVGTSSISVNDSLGNPHTMKYTIPAPITVYVDVTLIYNNATFAQGGYPSNGDALVAQAIANFGAAMKAAQDVIASALATAVFGTTLNGTIIAGVQGVMDVSLVKIGLAPSPSSSTTIPISPFQIASIAIGNVTVHSSGAAF